MTTKNTLMNSYSSFRNAGNISPKICGNAEELSEDIRERREEFTEDIKERMKELLEHYQDLRNHSNKLHKRIVKAFPHMHSSRYSNALKDLQDYLEIFA